MMDEMMTMRQVAEELGVNYRTFASWLESAFAVTGGNPPELIKFCGMGEAIQILERGQGQRVLPMYPNLIASSSGIAWNAET